MLPQPNQHINSQIQPATNPLTSPKIKDNLIDLHPVLISHLLQQFTSKTAEQQIIECLTQYIYNIPSSQKNYKDTNFNKQHFQIKIGSTPGSINNIADITLEKDINMIKAAFLYADKVDLYSYQTSLILQLLSLANINVDQALELLQTITRITDPNQSLNMAEGIERYKQYCQKAKFIKSYASKVTSFRQNIKRAWQQHIVEKFLKKIKDISGIDALTPIIKSGDLKVHTFRNYGSIATMEFFLLLAEALVSTSSYPLFDDSSANLINTAIDANVLKISELTNARAKHISLAANIIERLPLFDEASVSEIIDIKRELHNPLVRFRSAMMQFSEQVKSELWNKDFLLEAESLFRKQIEPAVLDIEESVKTNKYLIELSRNFFDKKIILGGVSTLVLMLSKLSDLPEVLQTAFNATVPIAATLGTTKLLSDTYDTYQKVLNKDQEIEKNQLFFYYKAGQRLLRPK